MGAMSPVITLHCLTTSSTRCSYGFNNSNSRFNALVEPTRGSSVFAKVKSQSSASKFNNNPDWKTKFKDDSEDRFRLPHVTDIFPDAVSMPSTFSPNMRTPRTSDFPGYPLDEDWYGYINDNDRVLLKVPMLAVSTCCFALRILLRFSKTLPLRCDAVSGCAAAIIIVRLHQTIYYSSSTSAGAKCIDPGCNWVEQRSLNCFSMFDSILDVLQIVVTLEIYDVTIVGIPFGYRGFSDEELTEVPLSRKVVQNIHLSGGRSLLGVSRGGPGVSEIVDNLKERGINMLFVLGGNDTHAGANAIHNEVHGAFAGFSGITVSTCNTHYAYFPIPEVISHPKLVDPNSRMWHRCLTSTGQPDFI
ncbi:ATP-dependent 6-phosphofructokinase 5, chloroplastic [Glycine soja]